MASNARHWEQNKEATVYVGNLHEDVTQPILTELMNHHGRVRSLNMPIDRVNGKHQSFGFVEFATEEDAEYVIKILGGTRLYGTPIRMNMASADKQKTVEVGAELFIGNLDAMVDEKALYDTFNRFGSLSSVPKVARDDANMSKGYGFVSYADFESSDNAIAHMHGQFMMNKQISVQYAYKKDGRGERHGDEAERLLAKQAKAHGIGPAVEALPAHLFESAVVTHQAITSGRGVPGAPSGPNGYGGHNGSNGYGGHGAPNGYGGGMPPRGPPASLPPPSSGLPARPPNGAPANFYAPMNGFGGPGGPGGMPPGFHPPPPGVSHGPPGMNQPRPGFHPGR